MPAPTDPAAPAGLHPDELLRRILAGERLPPGALPAAPANARRVREVRPTLTPEEAGLQAQLFDVLRDRGVPVRDQGGVYPYLLRQIALAVVRR